MIIREESAFVPGKEKRLDQTSGFYHIRSPYAGTGLPVCLFDPLSGRLVRTGSDLPGWYLPEDGGHPLFDRYLCGFLHRELQRDPS